MNSSLITLVLPCSLAIIMFGLGMSLVADDFRRVARHPKAVSVALLCQVVLLPTVAFGLVQGFGLRPDLAVGFMLLAGLTAWLCLRSLLQSGRAFDRSRQELRRNLDWIIKVVSEGGSLRLRQPQHWSRYR